MAAISRRSLLFAGGVSVGAVLVGCSAPAPAPAAPPAPAVLPVPDLVALEQRYATRIGVHAVDTGSAATVGHRADERFLMCSTVKALMAASVLHLSTADPGLLDRRVPYTAADLLEYAPVTAARVGTEMTVAELCAAAVTVSDNTAHNLLLRETGGPAALTAYLRGLGDGRARRTTSACSCRRRVPRSSSPSSPCPRTLTTSGAPRSWQPPPGPHSAPSAARGEGPDRRDRDDAGRAATGSRASTSVTGARSGDLRPRLAQAR
jgi:beta-lactamase class A